MPWMRRKGSKGERARMYGVCRFCRSRLLVADLRDHVQLDHPEQADFLRQLDDVLGIEPPASRPFDTMHTVTVAGPCGVCGVPSGVECRDRQGNALGNKVHDDGHRFWEG